MLAFQLIALNKGQKIQRKVSFFFIYDENILISA